MAMVYILILNTFKIYNDDCMSNCFQILFNIYNDSFIQKKYDINHQKFHQEAISQARDGSKSIMNYHGQSWTIIVTTVIDHSRPCFVKWHHGDKWSWYFMIKCGILFYPYQIIHNLCLYPYAKPNNGKTKREW
jgi:hypothetical protein